MYHYLINPIFVWNKQRLENESLASSIHQEKLLERIIHQNRSVPYLQSLNIVDVPSFRANCPLVEYDHIEPYILTARDEHRNSICADAIIAFSKSSGTTSRSKYIPLTKSGMEANFTAGKTMLSHYIAAYPDSKIFDGKNFSLTGSYTQMGSYIVGDVSALFTYFLSPLYRAFRTPNMQIATLPDWNEKLDQLMPILSKADIRWIAGVPSWMRIVVDRLEDYTQKNIEDVWPHLEVYFYGGINIKPFEKYFYSKFKNVRLWQTYNASEGFFGLQMEKNTDSLGFLLNTDTYYELLPFAEIEDDKPEPIALAQAKNDTLYELIVTNTSGLYRYRTGDVVRTTQLQPLRFEICGRTKNSINVFGEELMVHNTEMAIAALNQEMDFLIKDYTVAPILLGNAGHHHWQIEFIKDPLDMNYFQLRLDQILRNINSDYDAKRYNDYILKPLTVEVLRKNSIDQWLELNNRKSVQAKIPKLWGDSTIQNQLRKIARM